MAPRRLPADVEGVRRLPPPRAGARGFPAGVSASAALKPLKLLTEKDPLPLATGEGPVKEQGKPPYVFLK
jgi:hypothetical protein